MKNKITIFTLLFVLLGVFSLFLLSTGVQAVDLKTQVTKQIEEGAKAGGLGDPVSPQFVIIKVIKITLAITGSIFLALIFYGGFIYLNSRGDEEQVKKAQKIIVGAIIGLAIILFSYSITLFIGAQMA